MTKATGARHGMSYVAESVYGTTPGPSPAPDMKRLRFTGTTIGLKIGELLTAEMREDGQITTSEQGNHSGSGNIDVELSYLSQDDFLAAVMRGAWVGDVLKAGTLEPSFAIERRFPDIGQYIVYKGIVVDTFALKIAQSDNGLYATGTFGVFGQTAGAASSSSLGTPDDIATDSGFTTFRGSVSEDGSPIAIVTGITLGIKNGIATRYVIGSPLSGYPSRGRLEVTGELTAYFENVTLYNKFVNGTESALSAELEDAAGNTLTIAANRIKYTGGDIPMNGEGDIILTMPFRALRDDSDASPLVFTRDAA